MNLPIRPTGLTRYQPAAATPLALPAPTLPETTAFGGINLDHLTTGDRAVTLQAGPYDAFLPGDRLDVYWGGATSPIATAPVTREGIVAYVDIPGAAIIQAGTGLKEYSFTLISALGPALTSDPASVLVDLDAPGDPDPGIDPINPKLPAPTVIPMIIDAGVAEGGAEVTVPAWANMAANDVLSVYWGTVPVKVSNPAVGQAVVVPIDKTTILAAGDSPTLPVSYDIVDAVGNYSKRSPSTLVNVQASTTFFIAPKVLEAPTNVLDLDQLGSADVQVQVDPEQEGIALGDTVTLTWKGLTGEGIVVPPLTYTQTVDAVSYMIFPIANAVAAALAQGSALLYYEANGRKSKDRQLSVIGQVQVLAAPLVQEANGGVLDPADLTDVAHLQIDPYSVMSLGDTVTYYWTGKLAGSTASFLTGSVQVSGNDLNPPKPLVFTIPKTEIDALVGGTVEVYYTVDTYTRALLNPSASLVLSIAGTVALPAPTVDYVVGGVLDPVNAPTGTNVRVATTYAGAAKGDIVRVLWNGKDAANSYSNSFAVNPGVEIVCAIPVQYITGNESAAVTATYQVERTGEPTRYAEPLVFQIGVPAPIVVGTPEIPLALGNIIYLGEIPAGGLPVQVPPYEGMAVGQKLRIQCAGKQTQEFGPVTVAAIATQTIAVPKTYWITETTEGASLVRVTYIVEAGGTDWPSDELLITAKPGSVSTTAPAPSVTRVVGGELPVGATQVQTLVPADADLALGDVLTVHWAGAQGTGSPSFGPYTIYERQVGEQYYTDAVPEAVIAVNAGRTVTVTYTITHPGRPMRTSMTYSFTVAAAPFTIDPTEAVLTGTQTYSRKATGGVQPYTYTSSNTGVVRVVNPGLGDIQAVADGSATITARDSASHQATYPVSVSGNTPFAIDPTEVTLIGNETYTRQATGGTPPYTYTSSNAAVVRVPDPGKGDIQAVANGSATITARDSASHQGTYPVQVGSAVLTENFESLPLGRYEPLDLESMHVDACMISEFTRTPWLSGRCLYPLGLGFTIEFSEEFTHVVFGMYLHEGVITYTCYALDANDQTIAAQVFPGDYQNDRWIEFSAVDGRKIKKLRFPSRPSTLYFDNFTLTR